MKNRFSFFCKIVNKKLKVFTLKTQNSYNKLIKLRSTEKYERESNI